MYKSENSLVYKARRESDQKYAVIKMLANEQPSLEDAGRLYMEYEIGLTLGSLNGIVKMHSFEKFDDIPAIVMDYFEGKPLSELILSSEYRITEYLDIAIKVAEILGEIHSNNVIHKDINPSNILWNPNTKEVKIIDFGIASRLSQEMQTECAMNSLEGSIMYISPEQTGRIRRFVDFRTDYYSFGVTLYELFTKKKPFYSEDVLEIIYSHVAKNPERADNIRKDLPRVIADIIAKLMAKNPEERYQSSFGIVSDLKKCLNNLEKKGQVEFFVVGKSDFSQRFEIPNKLYGREKEIEKISEIFQNIVTNFSSNILLVSGVSGIGKSSLINELGQKIFESKGYFVSGKFEQLNRNTPYLPLINAFRDLIRQILTLDDEEVEKIKNRILYEVGSIGQVIVDIIPELETIIGKQPELPTLDPVKSQHRFEFVFSKFIKALSSPENPIVIFIDDLQWADIASLKLIELILTNPEVKSILIVGAYRSDEVLSVHPLCMLIDRIKEYGKTVEIIELTPLKIENVNELVLDALNIKSEKTYELSRIIYEKAKGNPFFVGQYLKALYGNGIIKLNFRNGFWECDEQKLQKSLLFDSIECVVDNKIKKLPEDTKNILKLAACCGNKFDLEILSIISKMTRTKIHNYLWEALKEGIILPVDSSYKYLNNENYNINVVYKFAHDKLQQAVYELLNENEKKETHFRIGNVLINNLSEKDIEEKLFELVNHLNIGVENIKEENKKIRLVELNLSAGKKARNSAAYDIALRYLRKGYELLPQNNWNEYYYLTLELVSEIAQCSYLVADYEEMERMLEIINKNAKKVEDRLKVYEIRICAYSAQNKAREAVKLAVEAINIAGYKIKINPSIFDLLKAIVKARMKLVGRRTESIIDTPAMRDEVAKAVTRIARIASTSAYVVNLRLWTLLGILAFELTLKYGASILTPVGFGIYSVIYLGLGSVKLGIKWWKYTQKSFEINGSAEVESFYHFGEAVFYLHNIVHFKEVLKRLNEAYIVGIETGEHEFASFALFNHSYHSFVMGSNLKELLNETIMALNIQRERLKNETGARTTYIVQKIVSCLMGREKINYSIIGHFIEQENEEAVKRLLLDNTKTFAFFLFFAEMYLGYMFYNYDLAWSNAKKCKKYFEGVLGLVIVTVMQFYEALNGLSLYDRLSKKEKIETIALARIYCSMIKKRADYAPMNHLHKYYLLKAEIARVKKQYVKALKFYEIAISLARENEFLNEQALANELLGKCYLEMGLTNSGYIYLAEARKCYEIWGAFAKVIHIEISFPEVKKYAFKEKSLNNHTTTHTGTLSVKTPEMIDINSFIKASQAILSEVEYNRLIEKLMKIIAENAGAQKILLLAERERNYYLEAEYFIESGEIFIDNVEDVVNNKVKREGKFPKAIVNYVARTKQLFILDDSNSYKFSKDEYLKKQKPKSLVCIPFIHQDKISKILCMENNISKGVFTEENLKVINLLMSQAVIAIENAVLFNKAVTDGLTQIKNRAFLDNYLVKRIYESKRYGSKLSIMLLDIDHFKSFNDMYGHHAGDFVLMSIAQKIDSCIRKSDMLARYGGEEFAVVMPSTSIDGALATADKVRKEIEDSSFVYTDGKESLFLKVTISIGVSQLKDNEDMVSLLKRVDKNLYKAKKNGRNRVESDLEDVLLTEKVHE